MRSPGRILQPLLLFLGVAAVHAASAQELEPRRWSHLPVGINFAAAAYAYTDGNIFLDPAVLVEDAQAEIHTLGLAYIRTFGLFGKSARVDVSAPFSNGHWEGQIDGQFAETRRQGFGDPKVRLAINLLGSPAQTPAEFAAYRTNTVVGAALEVTVPIGEYFEDRLVNLGSNRWVLRPQLGIVHNAGKWTYEATASAWFFGDNDDYQAPGRTLEQNPLYALQLHLIHTFRPGLWASASAAYGTGARAIVAGVRNPYEQANALWALSLGIPIDRRQGIKLAYQVGRATETVGVDYERLILAYSLMWGGS
jgi:Putative MetA-pathway of phenol degradation